MSRLLCLVVLELYPDPGQTNRCERGQIERPDAVSAHDLRGIDRCTGVPVPHRPTMNWSEDELVMTCDRAVVVIPAHNEAANLPKGLTAVVTAAAYSSMPVLTVVVLDACDDTSIDLAGRFGSDVHFRGRRPQCRGFARFGLQLRAIVLRHGAHRRVPHLVRHDGRRHPRRSGLVDPADRRGC
jgi:hypothetical protein